MRFFEISGAFLNQRTRGQDLACRLGGEEFAIILAGASIDAACKRGELLCEEVRQRVFVTGARF